jgi:hypothetical protein
MTDKQFSIGMRRLHICAGLGMLVGPACPLLGVGLIVSGMIGFFKAGQLEDKKELKKTDDIKNSQKHNAVSMRQGTSQTAIPNTQKEGNVVAGLPGARGSLRNEAYFNRNRRR